MISTFISASNRVRATVGTDQSRLCAWPLCPRGVAVELFARFGPALASAASRPSRHNLYAYAAPTKLNNHCSDQTQGVFGGYPLLRRKITEHGFLLAIFSAHRFASWLIPETDPARKSCWNQSFSTSCETSACLT